MPQTIDFTNIPPEILVYNTVSSLLQFLKEDIEENSAEPSKMVLYDILGDMNLLKHNYFEEGRDLFSRNKEHPRHIGVRQFFDAKRADIPTIHLTLSTDNQEGWNSIGLGQELYEYEESYMYEDENGVEVEGQRTSPVYSRVFGTSLQLVVTSSNHHEVLLIYHVLRSGLLSCFDTLELDGFQNIKFSGRELQIREDLAPNLFSRGLTLSGTYEVKVRRALFTKRFKELFVENSTPYDSKDKEN